ncbi:hypothetical protein AAIB33_18440 [Microbacterium sp. AZCO]|uniref:hypothetical protein n=1 Tax=Microbacterium sp. AZCO TaxID=3142976 RepID=UPI0031F37339
MRHVTYAEKTLFVDDTLADLLMEYSRLIAAAGESDTVEVPAVGADGNEVRATFLLTSSTVLMTETTSSDLDVPADDGLAADLRKRIRRVSAVNVALPEDGGDQVRINEDELS